MRTAPYKLAAFGILITILRIAMFVLVIDGGFRGWLPQIFAGSFAIFIAAGVYISAYFVRPAKTRGFGLAGLVLFGISDLWFNEATVVYYTSSAQLIAPESNFVGMQADVLRYLMQLTALGFGALPTLGAAVLGGMQAGAAQVAELNRPGLTGRISTAIGRIVSGFAWGFAFRLEAWGRNAPQQETNPPQSDRQISAGISGQRQLVAPRRWHTLTADEAAFIRQNSRAEIMATFGVSDGTAGDWKGRLNAGEKPWQKQEPRDDD